MSSSLHPDWHSTDEGTPVPVRVTEGSKADDAPSAHQSKKVAASMPVSTGRSISRKPAAVAGILVAIGIGYTAIEWKPADADLSRSLDTTTAQLSTDSFEDFQLDDLSDEPVEEKPPAPPIPTQPEPTPSAGIPQNPYTATPGQITSPDPHPADQQYAIANTAAPLPENPHSGAPLIGQGKGKPGKQPTTGAGTIVMTGLLSLGGILWSTRRMFAEEVR